MRKILTIIMVIVFVLALGCSKPADVSEQPAVSPEPSPAAPAAPVMGQVEHPEEVVAPPQAPASEPASETPATIGTRVEDTQVEAVDEDVSEDVEEIKLTAEKTMSSGDKTVSVGTTLAWKNYDSWPHQLAVETGKGFDTKRHVLSDRLLEGGVFEYTFEEKGEFLVRDIFSGNMRMYVTVE